MNQKPPPWQRLLLHGILIGGSIMFLLPYMWLVGTSWKLDKEIQSKEINILPQSPAPRAVSPYVDDRTFNEIACPQDADPADWDKWIRQAAVDEISHAVDAWRADSPIGDLPTDELQTELAEGVFEQLVAVLPLKTWSTDEPTLRETIRKTIKPRFIRDSYDQSYRYFALGKIIMKDRDYRIHQLTADRPLDDVWKVSDGYARLDFRDEAQGRVAIVEYDFDKTASFEIATTLPLGIDFQDFKRISVSFRRDQTWHELRAFIEINGKLYRSAKPKYLGKDDYWEASFQLPSDEDDKLAAKRYVLLDEIDASMKYDHGPNIMRLRIQVSRSSLPEACLAKGTENYREVFEEVPFWQYLKTSAFLAIANILGTCLSCSLAAYAFARLNWPGRDFCFILVLATLMIPPQVTMIPSFVIYKQLGWYNTLSPLWIPSCLAVNAFAIFLLRQAMKGLPRDLEDAAKIDGCGFFRTYWHVALPLMKPTLAAISVFTFMYVWNDFMGPLIYINDQRLYPLALGLFSFMAGREAQFTLIMAASVVMSIPVIVTFFLLQRYFIQGVALTGMKN